MLCLGNQVAVLEDAEHMRQEYEDGTLSRKTGVFTSTVGADGHVGEADLRAAVLSLKGVVDYRFQKLEDRWTSKVSPLQERLDALELNVNKRVHKMEQRFDPAGTAKADKAMQKKKPKTVKT